MMPFVLIVLSLLLAAALGFLALLALNDLTPKAALYKILGRFGNAPTSLAPALTDAPYRRIRPITGGDHRPILLNLETSDGSGQACHPDVAFIPEGFGADRWTYWMACTPFPYGNDSLENPELFASHDGLNWVVPRGLTNPLVPTPRMQGDHNSDPDILFCDSELWLFYRETTRRKTPNENRIYLMKSRDGVHWSTKIEALREDTGAGILSPSVISDGTRFVMWTVEIVDNQYKLVRRYSRNGIDWGDSEIATVSGLPASRHLWHIDVIQEKGRLGALLVSSIGIGGTGSRLHYAFSEDGGLQWLAGDYLLEQTYEFESNLQYRSTFRQCEEDSSRYELWYSARNTKKMFSIAYLQLARVGNRLLPIDPASIPADALCVK